jgi:hypothetical protein
MTTKTPAAPAPLWAGTVSVLHNHYYAAPVGVAVRSRTAHMAAHRAVAEVRAKLPSRARVTGIVVRLERQPAPRAERSP